jgi:NAD(P)-dependent dehydrogenase (short-subunit alcohol dehydrogenase family)
MAEYLRNESVRYNGNFSPSVGHFQHYGYGKIVNLSGGGASASLPRFTAYAASKTAVVRFTETLADELKGEGIDVNAVAPGALATAMTEAVLEAGPETIGSEYHAKINKIISEGGMCIREAAELCAWLCSADSDGISGRLIAAQWDPWRSLACRRDALDCSDIYTLRRILPADRQQDWSD